MSPPEDLQAALVAAEVDADAAFGDRPVGSGALPCGLTLHWVAFELRDEGEPAAGVRYELRLPGRVVTGALNERGRVRVGDIAEAGTCTIVFPELDADAEGAGEAAAPVAVEGSIAYVPGKVPEPVALDAAHRYHLPEWDLVELDLAAPDAAPGDAAVLERPVTGEQAEEEDDWDVVSIGSPT